LIFITVWFPLAIYCLTLAYVNRSQHPVMVRGTWDFAGVLFALSGFLLLGGPAILNGLYEDRRTAWAQGKPEVLPGLEALPWIVWAAVWLGYFTAVVGVAGWQLWRRRNLTCVYNVEPAAFDLALAKTFEHLGLAGTRTANRVVIEPLPSSATCAAPVTWLELDPFPAFRNVTLVWPEEAEPLRADVERELASILEEVPSGQNPMAGWLLAIALLLMCMTFLGIAFVLATFYFRLPR
jgi:hypothetical protein